MRWMIGLLALSCLSWVVAPARAQGPAAPPISKAYLRQPAFVIPFHVDPQVQSPIEVQLFVSQDGGRTWQLAARELPAVGRFSYQAPQDGAYWFTSRTIGRTSQRLDQSTLRPELLVFVDRRQPEVDLQLSSPGANQIRASWTIVDTLLDTRTVQLEYRVGADTPWQPVGVNLPDPKEPMTRLSGSAEWSVAATAGIIDVRLAVRDLAGNLTAVNRRLALTPRRDGSQAYSPPTHTAGLEQRHNNVVLDSEGAQVWQPENRTQAPPRPAVATTGAAPPQVPDAGIPQDPFAAQVPPAPPSVTQSSTFPTAGRMASARTSESNGTLPNSDTAAAQVEELPPPQDETTQVGSTGSAPALPAGQSQADNMSTEARSTTVLPTGERPVFSKRRRFQLDYDVEAVGVNNVSETQLWVTTDGGQTWKLWGKDPDRQSPFDVSVDRDGIYGFRMIVVGDNGLATPKPQPGDTADLWVAVDSVPPVVQFTGARYGTGRQAGELVITWNARDAHLTATPVSLDYATSPQGPWQSIMSELPNSGEFAWRPSAGMPRRIYLRVSVIDEAGNVGHAEHSDPIDLAGLAPRARIRGVIPRE